MTLLHPLVHRFLSRQEDDVLEDTGRASSTDISRGDAQNRPSPSWGNESYSGEDVVNTMKHGWRCDRPNTIGYEPIGSIRARPSTRRRRGLPPPGCGGRAGQ